jgi:hypothetical protein
MVVEYGSSGAVLQELLPRNQFPAHAYDTKEEVDVGRAAMGYNSGVVWFWLPSSTDYVTISTSTGKVEMTKTQLPQSPGRTIFPLFVTREASGKLLAQVAERDQQGARVMSQYTWSSETGWLKLTSGQCDGQRLIGAQDVRQVYLPKFGHVPICAFDDN